MTVFPEINAIADENQLIYRVSSGVICEVKNTRCFVLVDAQPREAQRAASCLVEPQVGDVVLFARSEEDYWIIAVLTPAGQRNVQLQGPTVCAEASDLRLTAQCMTTTSHQWEATHVNAEFAVQRLKGHVAVVEWLSERVTSFVGLLVGRFRNSLREVSDIDSTKCGNYDLSVDQTMTIASENGVITGKKVIKLDGSQVQIG